jgi:hypothetical protein
MLPQFMWSWSDVIAATQHDMPGHQLQHLSHSHPLHVVDCEHAISDGDVLRMSCPSEMLKRAAARGTLESLWAIYGHFHGFTLPQAFVSSGDVTAVYEIFLKEDRTLS